MTFSPGAEGGTLKAVYAPEGAAAPVVSEISVRIASDSVAPDVPVSVYSLWKGNEARTGYIREDGPKDPGDPFIIDLRPNGTDTKSMPLVDGSPVTDGNGNVFFTVWTGGMAGDETANGLYSYTTDGKLNWRSDDVNSRTTATYFDGRLYVGHIGGPVMCLDAGTGDLLWTTSGISVYPFTGMTSSPLVIRNDEGRTLMYVVTNSGDSSSVDNYLYVFEDNGDSCTELYKIPVGLNGTEKNGGAGMFSSVSMNADRTSLYVGAGGGVIAFDPETMVRQWSFDAGAQGPKNRVYVGTPVYYNGSVYVAASGALYSLNASTGLENWHVTNKMIYPSTPAVTETQVIATGYTNETNSNLQTGIAGYDLSDGHLLWHFDEGDAQRTSPIVAGDTVYFTTFGSQTLFAVDITKTDGGKADLRWSYVADEVTPGWLSLIEGTPMILNGTLYIGAENGYFYTFSDSGSGNTTDTFTITAAPSRNGVIRPAGDTVVEAGGSVVCTISPDNGWHIADVLVDGVSVGAVSSYRFSNVDSDHTIAAVYEKDGTQPKPTRDTVRELIAYLTNGDPLREDYNYDLNNDFRINGKDLILAEMMSA